MKHSKIEGLLNQVPTNRENCQQILKKSLGVKSSSF